MSNSSNDLLYVFHDFSGLSGVIGNNDIDTAQVLKRCFLGIDLDEQLPDRKGRYANRMKLFRHENPLQQSHPHIHTLCMLTDPIHPHRHIPQLTKFANS